MAKKLKFKCPKCYGNEFHIRVREERTVELCVLDNKVLVGDSNHVDIGCYEALECATCFYVLLRDHGSQNITNEQIIECILDNCS